MSVAEASSLGPSEVNDERSRRIVAELEKVIDMSFANETPLEDVLKYLRSATSGTTFPDGLPIYIDPVTSPRPGRHSLLPWSCSFRSSP